MILKFSKGLPHRSLLGSMKFFFVSVLTFIFCLALISVQAHAKRLPDFSQDAKIPSGTDRQNIYSLDGKEYEKRVKSGRIVALKYPVTVTGLKMPYGFMDRVLEKKIPMPGGLILNPIFSLFSPWKSKEDLYQWLGLTKYPLTGSDEGFGSPYALPSRADLDTDYLGATLLPVGEEKALTFSCAACHVGQLFGRPVVGLTNRRPRAFDFIEMGVKMRPLLNPHLVSALGLISRGEREMLSETFESVRYVRTKSTLHPTLDTSLAIVGLSLSARTPDEFATRDPWVARRPRPNPLTRHSVDSKPAVWWNVKYKTRWLSDGSVVSGNPIFTNILWNEIGRGSDLVELERWMNSNRETIKDLTAAVFASRAPRYTDFFKALDIDKAERGRLLFEKNCASCHGVYEKNWQKIANEDWQAYGVAELSKTTKVTYHEQTPVVDVGTDPNRYQGMQYFSEDLNRLKLSREFGTVVVPQKGYVPPPLVGIWARWPYFHNNSVPSLCEVLTPSSKRLKIYYGVPADNPDTDFDTDCVGYPAPRLLASRDDAIEYRATSKGMQNTGHDEGIFMRDGKEILSKSDKMEIIEFLKTL